MKYYKTLRSRMIVLPDKGIKVTDLWEYYINHPLAYWGTVRD